MPTKSADGLNNCIEDTLRSSLHSKRAETSLQKQLVSSSKRILMHKIGFRPAEKSASYQLETLRSKYVPLNPSRSENVIGSNTKTEVLRMNNDGDPYMSEPSVKSSNMVCHKDEEGLPMPTVVLYPPEKVRLEWPRVQRVGTGLDNLGNTCFLNSTLQCLTYTPPLYNYLVSNEHTQSCKVAGFCMVCELQRHIRRCFGNERRSIEPRTIVQKLRVIAKHMTFGRQEDAHEFLRYVVDHMQKASLHGYNKLDRYSKETTVVNQIFGGYLRSQVLCLQCKARSNTFDPFLDLNIDVKNVNTILKGFERFVQPERLDLDNSYNCTKCKQRVPASKRFTIHKPPNVLTIQLKRFDCSRALGGKVTRHIQFPEHLDVRPYMSIKQGEPVRYQLYAALVHSGYSCNSGHYYCYVRAPNLTWYCMNDSMVSQTNVSKVLNAEAYLLFYSRRANGPSSQMKKAPIIGPKLPNAGSTSPVAAKGSNSSMAGNLITHSDMGSPVMRKHSSDVRPATATKSTPPSSSLGRQPAVFKPIQPSFQPTIIPDVLKRQKISFGIKPKPIESASTPEVKPRIVVHIKKNGNEYSSSVTDPISTPSLVPYNDESDSDNDLASTHSHKANSYHRDHIQHATNSSAKLSNGDGASKSGSVTASSAESVGAHRLPFAAAGRQGATSHVYSGGRYSSSDSELVQGLQSNGHKHLPLDNGHNSDTAIQEIDRLSYKRSFNDTGLSIKVPLSDQLHVNSTTRWHILDQDSQISPSLASESSAGSVNSTERWHVSDTKQAHGLPVMPEARYVGWTITPSKDGSKQDQYSPTMKSSSDGCAGNTIFKKNMDEIEEGEIDSDKYDLMQSKSCSTLSSNGSTLSSSSTLTSPTDNKPGKTAKSGAMSLLKPCLGVDPCMSPGDMPYQSKNTDKKPYADGEIKRETKKSNNVFTQFLNSISTEDFLIDESQKKGHKKHKKHKKHKHKDSIADKEEDSTTSSDITKHKKKKKHKKHRHEDEEPLLGSPESSNINRHKRKWSEDDGEFEWVEKTYDTISKPSRSCSSAPVHVWDAHIRNDHKQSSIDGSASNPPIKLKMQKRATVWDGKRSAGGDVVSYLEGISASRGYGSQVSTWDGEKHELDCEAEHDWRQKQKRSWENEYEEELDRGKIKQVSNSRDYYSSSHGNMFQKCHDEQKNDKEMHHSNYIAADRDRHGYSGHGRYDTNAHKTNHRDGYHRDAYHRDRTGR